MQELKKVTIEAKFYTDGDYSIDPGTLMELGLEYVGDHDIIGTITYDKESPESLSHNPWYAVRDYLQKLVVSFHVYYTHYYVLGYLYNMVEDLLNKLSEDNDHQPGETYSIHGSCSGNYEGTEITITLECDDIESAPAIKPITINRFHLEGDELHADVTIDDQALRNTIIDSIRSSFSIRKEGDN